ncbi:MAG: hypothetical protein E7439_05910 [Ruminococcaceae bacterium]|nr:hypothetical protein [Oscillospiraceae bacterium]
MKRIICILLVVLLLSGCSGDSDEMNRAMTLRTKLLAKSVNFDAVVTADYGDAVYTFTMNCQSDTKGNVTFTVKEPETISGITGSISAIGGKLTFDDQALSFALLADGQLSPVSGPWILMRALRSGYLTTCGKDGENLRLSVDDSYADDALHLDVWLGEGDLPIRGEILWKGRRLLSVEVKNFTFV